MTEVWLHSNRRILLLAMTPVVLLAVLSGVALTSSDHLLPRVLAGCGLAVSLGLALGLTHQMLRPRIAYREGSVLFYLRAGPPIAVPLESVEAFFLGQGPASIPLGSGNDAETVNLVARISQRASEWQHVEVKEALGRWCDGYVTIRGTWCEPLTGEVIRHLNHRLRELMDTGPNTTEGG